MVARFDQVSDRAIEMALHRLGGRLGVLFGNSGGNAEVVLDDRQARRCARSLGLATTGTLGIILRAKRRGFIPAARPIIQKLLDRGLYLAHDLVEASLAEAGE